MLTTKLIRISNESEIIALKYGPSVSRGIIEMERLIGILPGADPVIIQGIPKRAEGIPKAIEGIPKVNLTDESWNRLERLFGQGIPKVNVKPASMFKPANTVPRDIIRDGWGDEPRDETGQILDE